MTRLNKREVELATVTRDLFLKGSPEWRVAFYAHQKNFTREQLSNFLDKLDIWPEDLKFAIYNHFCDICKESCFDKPKGFGNQLSFCLKKMKA